MMIWDLNIAVLYGRFLSYRGGLYNRFDCSSINFHVPLIFVQHNETRELRKGRERFQILELQQNFLQS